MRRINLFDFVELGEGFREASKIKDETYPFDAVMSCWGLSGAIRKMEASGNADFQISKHSINQVKAAIAEVDQRSSAKDDDGNDYKNLGFGTRWKLEKSVSEFRTILAAELRESSAYFVKQVGIYSTNDLIERAEHRFPESQRSKIDPSALVQYREAAKCLAFGMNTACAFHMMRAIESSLLSLMRMVCGRKFESLNANWGSYIAEMRKIVSSNKRKKPTKETIDLLSQIKDNHRNPVMHNEFDLTAQEAIDIFDLGSVVISHITDEAFSLSGANP